MKVLLSWLKEYVDIDVTPKELEEKLFSAGLEVEEVVYLGENIEKIYVGQVTSIEKAIRFSPGCRGPTNAPLLWNLLQACRHIPTV